MILHIRNMQVPRPMPTTWMFQANPNRFNIDGFLATRPGTLSFLVTRYAERIAVGDQVFMWRALGREGDDARSGIIAETEVIEPVTARADDPVSQPFWIGSDDADRIALRARLRVVRIAQQREIVQRRWLLEDPVLRDLTILKMANATNYEVPPAHAARLNALWSRTGRDWSYAESVAGLSAYHSTYGGQVSRLPDTPVAKTALLLGRAVTGCYNKVMNFRHLDPRDLREGMSGAGAMDRQVWATFFDPTAGTIREQALAEEFSRLWTVAKPSVPVVTEPTQDAGWRTEASKLAALSLTDLLDRFRALADKRPRKPATRGTLVRSFERDPLVVAIARVRAGFRCEVPECAHTAFEVADGTAYTEVHHIQPLSEGGEDIPINVACLCPAHHREAHYGRFASTLAMTLHDLRAGEANP